MTMLRLVQTKRVSYLEGPADKHLIETAADVRPVLEQCFSNRVAVLLLYASNLPDQFFDLSSGEAGAILQILFQYRIRLAIVRPSGAAGVRRTFREVMGEEARRGRVGLFDSADAARAWIEQGSAPQGM